MIKIVDSIEEANRCDELLTMLIQDERQYDNSIDNSIKINNYFNKILNDTNIKILAYYENTNIIGYLLIKRIDSDTCLLDGLYVEKEYRNKKVASSLIEEAFNQIKRDNIKYIEINVMYNNDIARHIYEKYGFSNFKIKMRKEM